MVQGMIKMFNAEVLSKFPVVQHFPFGTLFSWEQDPNAASPAHSIHIANQPQKQTGPSQATSMLPPPGPGLLGTAAPWASSPRVSVAGAGVPSMRAPPPRAGGGLTPVTGRVPLRGNIPSGPGPQSGVLGRPGDTGSGGDSTDGQITMTKAPWAQ